MHIIISDSVLCSEGLLERDPTFLTATAISNLRLQPEYGPDLDTYLDSPECLICYASAASFNYSFSFLCCLLLFIADHTLRRTGKCSLAD